MLGVGKAVASTPLTPDAEQAGFWLEAVLSYVAKAPPLYPRHRGHRARRSPEGDRMAQGNGQARGDEVGWLGCEELAPRVHPSHRATFFGGDEDPPPWWRAWHVEAMVASMPST